MPGISLAKDLPGLLYLQRALSNEFLLGGDRDEFFDHSGLGRSLRWRGLLRDQFDAQLKIDRAENLTLALFYPSENGILANLTNRESDKLYEHLTPFVPFDGHAIPNDICELCPIRIAYLSAEHILFLFVTRLSVPNREDNPPIRADSILRNLGTSRHDYNNFAEYGNQGWNGIIRYDDLFTRNAKVRLQHLSQAAI